MRDTPDIIIHIDEKLTRYDHLHRRETDKKLSFILIRNWPEIIIHTEEKRARNYPEKLTRNYHSY